MKEILVGERGLSFIFALLLGALIAGAPKSVDAATIYIYQGKGVGVMADTTSRWFDGNAGGVACTFEREHTGVLTYRFTRTANTDGSMRRSAPDHLTTMQNRS